MRTIRQMVFDEAEDYSNINLMRDEEELIIISDTAEYIIHNVITSMLDMLDDGIIIGKRKHGT